MTRPGTDLEALRRVPRPRRRAARAEGARAVLAEEDELELDDLDPDEAAAELAERLAEYRRVKAGAAWLEQRLAEESDRFFRLGPAPLAPRPERPLAPQEPGQLAPRAPRPRGRAAQRRRSPTSRFELPPVELFLERFRALLRGRTRFVFDEEVDGLSRVEQAVAFLALLELRKAGEVRLDQTAPFAPIAVSGISPDAAARSSTTGVAAVSALGGIS